MIKKSICIIFLVFGQMSLWGQAHFVIADGTVYHQNGELVLHNTSFINDSEETSFISQSESQVRMTGNAFAVYSKIGGVYSTTFTNLIIDKESNNILLEEDITIKKELTFYEGKLDLQNNDLTMEYGSAILGAGSSSYVKTSGIGNLNMALFNTISEFPIGNSSYNPLTIYPTSSNENVVTNYSARIVDASPANYTSGSAIQRMWHLNSDANNSSFDVRVQWSAGQESNGFNRYNASIAYAMPNASSWRSNTTAGAALGSNPFLLTGNVASNLQVLSVISPNAIGGLILPGTNNGTTDLITDVQLFPNPTTDWLQLKFSQEILDRSITLIVRNQLGQMLQLVNDKQISGQQLHLPLDVLPSGNYTLEIHENGRFHKALPFVVNRN